MNYQTNNITNHEVQEDRYPDNSPHVQGRMKGSLDADSCQVFFDQIDKLHRGSESFTIISSSSSSSSRSENADQYQLHEFEPSRVTMMHPQASTAFSMTSMTYDHEPGADLILQELSSDPSFGSMATAGVSTLSMHISTLSMNVDVHEPAAPASTPAPEAIHRNMDVEMMMTDTPQSHQRHQEPQTRINWSKRNSNNWFSQGAMSLASLPNDLSFRSIFDRQCSATSQNYNNEGSTSRSDSSDLIIDEKDVLSGRGTITNKHPGNIAYRELIKEHLATYQSLGDNKAAKLHFTTLVRDSIIHSGGRFLKKKKTFLRSDRECWVEMDAKAARKKVSQCFRDCKETGASTDADSTANVRPRYQAVDFACKHTMLLYHAKNTEGM